MSIVDEELESIDDIETVEEVQEEQPQEPERPRSRYDDWDRDTAVKNYQELERLNSRQAQELGELRRMANDYIQSTIQQPTPAKKIDVDALLEDPDLAIESKVEKHPAVVQMRQELQRLKQQEVVNALNTRYPEWQQTINDKEFADWVLASPARMRMYQMADQQLSLPDAEELLGTWSERQKFMKTQEVIQARDAKNKRDMNAAASESSSSGKTSGKVYRAVDLIRLQQTDPEKYEAMMPEILSAYQQGRVR